MVAIERLSLTGDWLYLRRAPARRYLTIHGQKKGAPKCSKQEKTLLKSITSTKSLAIES
ncbi:MAG: hypothetical protein ACI8WB_005427 [Phenylobacterium sp.]|jgi:hypothetical protein